MADTLTQQQLLEQISKMTAQIEALTSLVAPKTKSKKTSADSSSAASAEKKKRAPPDASAWNAQVSAVWEEMKASYRAANPSAEGLEDAEIRKQIKENKLPSGFATYAQALQEASRRKKAEDPEHAKKADARRAHLDAKQAEEKKEKKAKSKTSEAAPAPLPKPSAEPEISTFAPSDDPEEFNMRIKMPEGETFLLNAKNWVCSEDGTWVGIWDSDNKTIDRTAAEPE
jgi:hypothetical protein